MKSTDGSAKKPVPARGKSSGHTGRPATVGWRGRLGAMGLGFLLTAAPAGAAHQTPDFSPVYGAAHLPFAQRIEEVPRSAADWPTLHSYVAGQWDGCWLFLGGRTNGLHGMMGNNGFPVASANTDLWVIDPVNLQTWHRSLMDAGLSTRVVDFLSGTNHNFVQDGTRLFIAGGYGFDRTANDYVTYSHFASIDLPALIGWVKQRPGSVVPAVSIRTTESPLFQVTGGHMEKSGDHFLLIFGQNYPGRYRPMFDGTYTRQVRRFALLGDPAVPVLDPASVSQSPPDDDFRRRDLNVVPVLRREAASGTLADEFLALAGVFTPTTGVWTVPVTISASGVPTQPDPLAASTFKQGLHHYHSAKASLFDRVSGENFILQFGGLSAQYHDSLTDSWIADPQVPFVHHVSCLVRSATGAFHQTLLPAEFPDIRSQSGARLFFGTNAEFLPDPGAPLLRPHIIDLAGLRGPRVIGHIYGGLVSDAPNSGSTRAGADIFAVILEPRTVPAPALEIASAAPGEITLTWPDDTGAAWLLEQSTSLETWSELWPPPAQPSLTLPLSAAPRAFYRLLRSAPAIPSP